MINPKNNSSWIEYGYVKGDKVTNPEIFDPEKMTLTAARPTFHPIKE